MSAGRLPSEAWSAPSESVFTAKREIGPSLLDQPADLFVILARLIDGLDVFVQQLARLSIFSLALSTKDLVSSIVFAMLSIMSATSVLHQDARGCSMAIGQQFVGLIALLRNASPARQQSAGRALSQASRLRAKSAACNVLPRYDPSTCDAWANYTLERQLPR